jgi:2,4-dienoyl-CoA reductase-like NADH-dependent reductase (Old Yellow Enzyme family)
MPGLFDPITIKGLNLKNRIVMPPMANKYPRAEPEVYSR